MSTKCMLHSMNTEWRSLRACVYVSVATRAPRPRERPRDLCGWVIQIYSCTDAGIKLGKCRHKFYGLPSESGENWPRGSLAVPSVVGDGWGRTSKLDDAATATPARGKSDETTHEDGRLQRWRCLQQQGGTRGSNGSERKRRDVLRRWPRGLVPPEDIVCALHEVERPAVVKSSRLYLLLPLLLLLLRYSRRRIDRTLSQLSQL